MLGKKEKKQIAHITHSCTARQTPGWSQFYNHHLRVPCLSDSAWIVTFDKLEAYLFWTAKWPTSMLQQRQCIALTPALATHLCEHHCCSACYTFPLRWLRASSEINNARCNYTDERYEQCIRMWSNVSGRQQKVLWRNEYVAVPTFFSMFFTLTLLQPPRVSPCLVVLT